MKILRKINGRILLFLKKNWKKEDLESYLCSFNDPIDDIEASYYQYKVQCYIRENKMILFFKHFISIFLIFVFKRVYTMSKPDKEDKGVMVAFFDREDIIPCSIDREKIVYAELGKYFYLNDFDISYIKTLQKRYYKDPFFVFKIMIKISNYRYYIEKYEPTTILCSCEYSFTSSVLTNYCELQDIEHINVMHGEKIFSLDVIDCFCRFTKFYVWDDYYIKLFKKLRAYKSAFVVELPPMLKIKYDKSNQRVKYIYYLQIESEKIIKKIKDSMDKLDKGEEYLIRPHPLYKNKKLIDKYFDKSLIDSSLDINESISSTEYVISRYSTVLYQSFVGGKKVVIDDITNPDEFNSLEESGYIMLNKCHSLLSEMITD